MTKKDYVKQIFSLTSNSADRWMRTMPSTGSAGRRVELTMKNYNRWSEKQLAGRANTIRTSIRKKQKKETAKKVQEQVMRVRPERGYYVQNVPKGTRLGNYIFFEQLEAVRNRDSQNPWTDDEVQILGFANMIESGDLVLDPKYRYQDIDEIKLEVITQMNERNLNIKNWRERAIKRQKMPTIYR